MTRDALVGAGLSPELLANVPFAEAVMDRCSRDLELP